MSFSQMLFYSCIAGFAMLFGSILLFYFESWVRKNSIFLISFAAGVMLTIAFINLIPEAVSLTSNAWAMVFAGFLVLYVLQNVVMFHPCHDEVCETHKLGLFSFVGLTIHSLLDGVIVSVGFEAGWELGILTTTAVILHKMPDGITITGILLHSNTSRRKTALYSALVATATPIGAVVSYLFLKGVPKYFLGDLLALTSGTFIYLAASDLLPETHKLRHRANAIFFFLGVALIAIIGKLLQ